MYGPCTIRTASTRQVVFSRSPFANSSRGSDLSCLRDVRNAFYGFHVLFLGFFNGGGVTTLQRQQSSGVKKCLQG